MKELKDKIDEFMDKNNLYECRDEYITHAFLFSLLEKIDESNKSLIDIKNLIQANTKNKKKEGK